MANPVVHFEIIGTDGTALQAFYAELFGWRIDADNPLKYGLVEAAGGGIPGGIGASSQDGSTSTRFYVGVDDLQAKLDAASKLGATTVLPPSAVPGGPEIALFSDPNGNVVGLMKNQ